ncbi:hypothetical protein CO676_19795 [Sinorhizobium sp. BJ1]|nr:hypothetical protein CO676_19795 [Sinorhizobium sp. BJ1]
MVATLVGASRIGQSLYDYQWVKIVGGMELRDVLDMITVVHDGIIRNADHEQKAARQSFIAAYRRIFTEEQVRYRTDNRGGVHFAVDQEFENLRVSTISALGAGRFDRWTDDMRGIVEHTDVRFSDNGAISTYKLFRKN